MAGLSEGTSHLPLIYVTNYSIFILLCGIIFSTPVFDYVSKRIKIPQSASVIIQPIGYLSVLVLCFIELAQNSYNPFIYFRF